MKWFSFTGGTGVSEIGGFGLSFPGQGWEKREGVMNEPHTAVPATLPPAAASLLRDLRSVLLFPVFGL